MIINGPILDAYKYEITPIADQLNKILSEHVDKMVH